MADRSQNVKHRMLQFMTISSQCFCSDNPSDEAVIHSTSFTSRTNQSFQHNEKLTVKLRQNASSMSSSGQSSNCCIPLKNKLRSTRTSERRTKKFYYYMLTCRAVLGNSSKSHCFQKHRMQSFQWFGFPITCTVVSFYSLRN